MKHPPSIWTDPFTADYPLRELLDAYAEHLSGRSRAVSRGTVENYARALASFAQSVELHGEPPVLANLTPVNVERWIADLRAGKLSARTKRCGEDTISVRLSIIKTFSHKYIYRHLEMTHRDLLERVERYLPPLRIKEGLTRKQIEQVLACFDNKEGYRDVRDRALVAFYLASGLRFSEGLFLDVDQVDRYTGWAKLIQKGDRERVVKVGERALKALRAYLHVRRARPGVTRLFTTDEGRPFTYWGGQSIFRRLKAKAGLPDLHCHRFCHTWTQTALARGAERAVVQDAMGWTSDTMVRRYGGWVRSKKAAEAMPRFAPI